MVILGNSNKRFSGVTSTMLATLPGTAKQCEVAILGKHHIPGSYRVLGFWEMVKLCRQAPVDGGGHVFHARRNDEMIQALIAKKVFGAQLHILFTSTAQRDHSGFTKWLMKQMDGVLSTCQAAAKFLESPPQALIPHGVDLQEFTPVEDRETAWKSFGHGGDFGIGIFGRVRPSKGIDLLVEAAIPLLQADSRPTIVIIGETTPKFQAYRDGLQALIDEAGLSERILFLGKLPFAEVKRYFQAVSLVTALSRNEGFGLTVLEAMASGTTVLATKAGAWEEVIREKNHLIEGYEVESVRKSLAKLLTQYDLGVEGELNRKYAEAHHDINREVAALVAEYQKRGA